MTSREHPTATITTPNSTPGQTGRFGLESVAAFVGMRTRASIFFAVMLATAPESQPTVDVLEPRKPTVPADRMRNTPVPRRVPMKPVPGRAGRPGFGLVCALAFSVLWPGAGTTGELAWGDVATPLRIVNLNPFQLLYGVPGSLGARVMTRGSSELIASMDMASHLIEANSGAERVLIDGETPQAGARPETRVRGWLGISVRGLRPLPPRRRVRRVHRDLA